jgi:hypothetical protein
MATAHKSKLFRDIGKPSIALLTMQTMLAIGILLIAAGGFSLHSQLDNLKIELALAKRDVGTANERTISLEREVSQIRQDLARLDDRLSAMAKPTSPQNNSLITAIESKLIREFLVKIDAFRPMVGAGNKVGDTIPDDKLLDFSRIIAILDFVNVAR